MPTPLRQAAPRCRCPRCGAGGLYAGLLTVRPACTECGLDLSAVDTGDGAASAVIPLPGTVVIGAVVIGAVFWVEFPSNPPAWMHLLLWSTVTSPLALLLTRPLRATLVVQRYRHRTAEMGL